MVQKQADIPIKTIIDAMNADSEAVQAILMHFSKYINSLAHSVEYNQTGKETATFDEIRTRLEAKLICSIINSFTLPI